MKHASQPSQSSKSEHWAKLEEAGFSWGIAFLFTVHRFLGKLPFRIILYPVIAYFYCFRSSARLASKEYLEHLALFQSGIKVNSTLVFKHLLTFGESLLDKLLSHTGRYTLNNVTIVGREPIQALLEQKRGLVLFTAHIGNLEVSRAIAQFRNIPITILVHTKNSEKFNRILKHVNPNANVNLMQVEAFGAAQAIILANKISNGEVVIIAADRIPLTNTEQRTSTVTFLGKPAAFPTGPYILAYLLQCPVFLVFCTQLNGRYTLAYEPFSEKITLPRVNREDTLSEYAQQFANALEKQCKQTPLQWFNFYPFWKKI